MAGQRLDLGQIEHARLGAERRLGLAVVEPGIAARHHQDDALADPQRQRLGDPCGLHAMGGGGQLDRRAALGRDDDRDVGGMGGEEGADGIEAHRIT